MFLFDIIAPINNVKIQTGKLEILRRYRISDKYFYCPIFLLILSDISFILYLYCPLFLLSLKKSLSIFVVLVFNISRSILHLKLSNGRSCKSCRTDYSSKSNPSRVTVVTLIYVSYQRKKRSHNNELLGVFEVFCVTNPVLMASVRSLRY